MSIDPDLRQSLPMQRRLGGEGGRRGLFGGQISQRRAVLLGGAALTACILVTQFYLWGLAAGAVLMAATWLLTTETHRGSWWERKGQRRQFDRKQRSGAWRFRPLSTFPVPMEASAADRGAYRACPDGAEGFVWLQQGQGLPGIGYHSPIGERPWMTVVWQADGALRGLVGDGHVNTGMARFSEFLARYGPRTELVSRVQILTRAVPEDSAENARWIEENLDPSAPPELMQSYAELLDDAAADGLTLRHFVVVRWPVSGEFIAEAATLAPGFDGYRLLMAEQIRRVDRHLAAAWQALGDTQVMTARGVTALLRHLQVPDWPIDQAGSADPAAPWFPSEEEWGAVRAWGIDDQGIEREWLHSTAVVPITAVETGPRTAFWSAPLLSGLDRPVLRTISTQIELQPVKEALAQAKGDVTSDAADLARQEQKGVLTSEAVEVSRSAADQRLADLAPGSGHTGAGWAMHLTVSARSHRDLRAARQEMETAAVQAGINELEWLDHYPEAAQSATWPLARGMRPLPRTMVGRAQDLIAGSIGHSTRKKRTKEAHA